MEKAIELAETDLANQHDRLLQEEVDASIIAQIVAKWTGIPVTKMLETEAEKLLQLETELNGRVVGQKNAIIKVSEAIRRARTGLQDPHRPLGVFMFVGPTGVGKTELSKALACTLFSDEAAMIRLDMSEYMERHSVAKLIGSPPGYVGYDEGGQLTEALRRRPYAVVLLDEIEKAHPDVLNILLQLFDDGRITDSKGRTVNATNALFVLTSNIGSANLLEHPGMDNEKDIFNLISPDLHRHFRPEFLNRLDDILPFLPLKKTDMGAIADIRLNELRLRLVEKTNYP